MFITINTLPVIIINGYHYKYFITSYKYFTSSYTNGYHYKSSYTNILPVLIQMVIIINLLIQIFYYFL